MFDFANAFNSLHRFDMLQLQAVKERLPYVYSAYSSPTVLFYEPYTLLSRAAIRRLFSAVALLQYH